MKLLFDQNDLPKAQAIAERMSELFADKNVFGQRFISLSKASGQHEAEGFEQRSGEPLVSAQPPVREKPNVVMPAAAVAPPPAAPPVPRARST